MTTPKKLRVIKFAKALVAGKNQKEAAKDLNPNLSDKSAEVTGSQLAKLPETKAEIERLTKKHDVSVDRALKAYRRGLDEASPDGKLKEFADATLELHGFKFSKKEDIPQNQILINIINAIAEGEKAGI